MTKDALIDPCGEFPLVRPIALKRKGDRFGTRFGGDVQITLQYGPFAVIGDQLFVEGSQLFSGAYMVKVFALSAFRLMIGDPGDERCAFLLLQQVKVRIDITLSKVDEDAVIDLVIGQQRRLDLFDDDRIFFGVDAVGSSFHDDGDVIAYALMTKVHLALVTVRAACLQLTVDAGPQLRTLDAHARRSEAALQITGFHQLVDRDAAGKHSVILSVSDYP